MWIITVFKKQHNKKKQTKKQHNIPRDNGHPYFTGGPPFHNGKNPRTLLLWKDNDWYRVIFPGGAKAVLGEGISLTNFSNNKCQLDLHCYFWRITLHFSSHYAGGLFSFLFYFWVREGNWAGGCRRRLETWSSLSVPFDLRYLLQQLFPGWL